LPDAGVVSVDRGNAGDADAGDADAGADDAGADVRGNERIRAP